VSAPSPRPRFSPPDDEDFAELARGVHTLWLRDRWAAALDALPGDARRAILLRYVESWENWENWENWGIEVVAEDLGVRPGVVRTLCRRARAVLRAELRGAS
jgi:DNA-directed RNA polymerase specialized sigma24 family protein